MMETSQNVVDISSGEDVEERKPLVRTQALVNLVVKEFKTIERIEQEIAEKRIDIKEAIKRMRDRGLNRRGIKMALARRQLLVKGGLEQVDETLIMLVGIPALGIQGDLFESGANGEDAT